jgi:hypothetical protein
MTFGLFDSHVTFDLLLQALVTFELLFHVHVTFLTFSSRRTMVLYMTLAVCSTHT